VYALSAELRGHDCEYNQDGKILYLYRNDAGFKISGVVITPDYTANTISKGTTVVVSTNTANGAPQLAKGGDNTFVMTYHDTDNTRHAANVLTISGTSISVGATATLSSDSSDYGTLLYDSANDKFVAVYADSGNSSYVTAQVGTVSGTTSSWGTKKIVNSGNMNTDRNPNNFRYIPSRGMIMGVANVGSNLKTFAGEVDGTTTNWRVLTAVSGFQQRPCMTYDTTAERMILFYHDNSNSLKISTVEVYDSRIMVVRSTSTIESVGIPSDCSDCLFDSDSERTLLAYGDAGTSNDYLAEVRTYRAAFNSTNLTSENCIGVADASYTNGQTATVQTAGVVDDAQSGLTAGQSYFVQGDGALDTTADDPSVFAGTAVSATKIIVQG